MKSKSEDIKSLFDKVLDILDHGSRIWPFSSKVSVPEDELVDILEQLKESIPEEVDKANSILANCEKMLDDAKKDAAKIVQDANEQAEQIIKGAQAEKEAILAQSDIVRIAEETARELKENSEVIATQTKVDADVYSAQVRKDALIYAEEVMAYLTNDVLSGFQGKMREVNDILQSATENIGDNRAHINEEINKQNPEYNMQLQAEEN